MKGALWVIRPKGELATLILSVIQCIFLRCYSDEISVCWRGGNLHFQAKVSYKSLETLGSIQQTFRCLELEGGGNEAALMRTTIKHSLFHCLEHCTSRDSIYAEQWPCLIRV